MNLCTADFDVAGKNSGDQVMTTDAGNATAWDAVEEPNVASLTYDNTHAATATLAGKLDTSFGSASVNGGTWTTALGGTLTDWYGRICIWWNNAPVGFRGPMFGQNGPFSDFAVNHQGTSVLSAWDTTGRVDGTVTVTTGSWWRYEWHVVHSTTVGSWELRLYNSPTATTTTDSIVQSSRNTGTGLTSVTLGTDSGSGWSGQAWFDAIVIGATTWPGPVGGGAATNLPPRGVPFMSTGRI